MDINIFGKKLSIGTKSDIKMEKKNYVGSFSASSTSSNSYSSITEILSEGQISISSMFHLYKRNSDIRQCIRKISNSVARNGIYLQDNNKNDIYDEELVDTVFEYFKTPTFLNFRVSVFLQYLIGGDLYIIPRYNLKKQVSSFEVLDGRNVSKLIDKKGTGNIVGYRQYTSSGEYNEYKVDELAYFQFEKDVDNASVGMGLLHGAVYEGLADLEAAKYNYVFYQNDATPNKILMLRDTLSENEMKLAKEQFEKEYRGTNNAHKTMIAGGVSDIKTISLSHTDMDFINQRKFDTEKVCSTFGVPKNILGYVDNINLANGKELKKEYIEGTIIPYQKDFENILNTLSCMFLPDIYEKYRIVADGETLDDELEIREAERKDLEKGITTINEIRKRRGDEPIKTEEADKPLVNRNMVLLEDIALDATLLNNEDV